MTRETKIGLLVGLAFIIVIGILLGDQFSSRMEPPQAALSGAAAAVRQAVNSPGPANPPITMVMPKETPPAEAVPTHDELSQPPSPVVPSRAVRSDAEPVSPQHTAVTPPTAPETDQVAGADPPTAQTDLNQAARQRGESLVPSNIDGSSRGGATPMTADAGGLKSYKAQSGDSVSRMASRLLGENTRANRQAIIDANPSLQQDPDRVIVGKTYIIPGTADSAAAAPTAEAPNAAAPAPAVAAAPMGNIYTVQEGDSLWRIANDQLGDPSAMDSIKQLNMDVLKGDDHEMITPGMKLRLPGKPVASAN